MKDLTSFPVDLVYYLHESCGATGHGRFRIRSKKSRESVILEIEGTQSQRYLGNGEDLIRFLGEDTHPHKTERTVRSIVDIADHIVQRLDEIWRKASGNGCVELSCRLQRNGKRRFGIRHSFEEEVVLRPEELNSTEMPDWFSRTGSSAT